MFLSGFTHIAFMTKTKVLAGFKRRSQDVQYEALNANEKRNVTLKALKKGKVNLASIEQGT